MTVFDAWAAGYRVTGTPWISTIVGVKGRFHAPAIKHWITDGRGSRPLDPGTQPVDEPKQKTSWRL